MNNGYIVINNKEFFKNILDGELEKDNYNFEDIDFKGGLLQEFVQLLIYKVKTQDDFKRFCKLLLELGVKEYRLPEDLEIETVCNILGISYEDLKNSVSKIKDVHYENYSSKKTGEGQNQQDCMFFLDNFEHQLTTHSGFTYAYYDVGEKAEEKQKIFLMVTKDINTSSVESINTGILIKDSYKLTHQMSEERKKELRKRKNFLYRFIDSRFFKIVGWVAGIFTVLAFIKSFF